MKLSIVIPVYNEGAHIHKVIDGIEKVIHFPHETLLVYDSSSDSTINPARKLQTKIKSIKLVRNMYGKGALNAIKTGLNIANGEAVIVTMADCSDDPQTINAMISKFNRGYDIVCGSRYMPGGKKIGGPFIKTFLSWFAGVSGKYILGLPTFDLTNSFKLYRKSLLNKITIESQGGFELGMEIIVKGYFLYNAKVSEVPTIWRDRTAGTSRFKLTAWLPRYIHWYVWAVKKRFKFH